MSRIPSQNQGPAQPGQDPAESGQVPEPSFADILDQAGAEAIEGSGDTLVDDPGDELDTLRAQAAAPDGEHPIGIPKSPPEPSFADILSQAGAEAVVEPPPEPEPSATPLGGIPVEKTNRQKLNEERQKLDREEKVVRDNIVVGSEFLSFGALSDIGDRRIELQIKEREEELANTITFGGQTDPSFRNRGIVLRRLEEAAARVSGTVASTFARAIGNEDKANAITNGTKLLREYNGLIDRNSIFGKKFGPIIGEIGASIAETTVVTGATGGITGLSGFLGLETFANQMEEGKDLAPIERWQHATISAGIDVATTLAGGALAKKAGVASGETLIPFVGSTGTKLFSKTGLAKVALSSLIEAGEESFQTGAQALESYRSGVDPNALDNVWSDIAVAASTGFFVSGLAEVTTNAGRWDLPVKHYTDVMAGWTQKLRKPKTDTTAVEVSDGGSKYVETEDGVTVKRVDIEAELNALVELETEVNEQFDSGGAKELEQLLAERRDNFTANSDEVKGLIKKRSDLRNLGRAEDHPTVSNLNQRINIQSNYLKELDTRIKEENSTLSKWESEFKDIHKQELDFIKEETDRLSKIRDTPVLPPKVVKQIDTGEAKLTKAKETAQAPERKQALKQEPKVDKPPKGPSTVDTKGKFADLDADMKRARQQDIKRVREFFELDKLPQREAASTEWSFEEAQRLEIPERAFEMAQGVLETGKVMNSIELAGLQTRFADKAQSVIDNVRFLKDNPNLSGDAVDSRMVLMKDAENEIDTMTEAWLQSSSEAGAALQAQQRVLGIVHSTERALVDGRRLKGEALNADEITNLTKTSDNVMKAAKDLEGMEKGNREYDIADMALADAITDRKAAVRNLQPGNALMNTVEIYNATSATTVLTFDLIPLGRQGMFAYTMNPKLMYKNNVAFFKPFLNKSVKDVNLEAFKINRGLQEMKNFKTLTKDFNVPFANRDTPFSEVEASSLSRVAQATGFKKLSDLPVYANFETAFGTWLNQTRLTMADWAYEQNKHLLDLPGGKQEMQKIINLTMNATGHASIDLGTVGKVALLSPRWFLSRLSLGAKALKYVPEGAWSRYQGKKNASTWIAGQYVKMGAGWLIGASSMAASASLMFGPENVSLDLDPRSESFGILNINDTSIPTMGGMEYVFRTAGRLVRGAKEAVTGPDKIRDESFARSLGSILVNRTSALGRDVAFAFNSGKPPGINEKMALSEYLMRKGTPLPAQAVWDAAQREGYRGAALAAVMEEFGFSAFASRKSKERKKEQAKRRKRLIKESTK